MFDKLADFIMKNAKRIIVVWIVLLVASVPFIMRYNEVLQYDMSKMSNTVELESVKGSDILKSGNFSSNGSLDAGTIILIEVYDEPAKAIADKLAKDLESEFFFWKVNENLREKGGLECEITVKKLGRFDDKYFADKDTQMIVFTVSYPTLPDGVSMKKSDNVPDIRSMVKEAAEGVDGIVETYVTGTDAISYDTSKSSTNDIKKIDPISILLVLILIGLFFRSFVTAGTPPVVIGMAYGILLTFVYALGTITGIYYITTILVLVSMLGAGCDYCIFIVSRYREELIAGRGHEDALRESIIWAGESIVTSGISVVIGFGSLALCNFALVKMMGIILAIGIVLALLAALTFVPSLLMVAGEKIFWPSKIKSYTEGKATRGWYGAVSRFGQRYFLHSAQTAIKYAKVIVVATILVTVPLAYVTFTSNSSYDMISAMPPGEAKDGVGIISTNIGGGMLMPTMVTMKVDAFLDVNVNSDLKSGERVPTGSTVTVKSSPHPGYYTKEWKVGSSVEPVDSENPNEYTIDSISADTEVTAVFDKLKYTVNYESNDESMGIVKATGAGSEIVSGGTVDYGSEIKLTATPKENCRVNYWVILRDGESPEYIYTHDTELTIGKASYNYDFEVYFDTNPTENYTVTYTAGEHGKVVVRSEGSVIDSGASVQEDSYVIITAIPDDGYIASSLHINGAPILGVKWPYERMVSDNMDISVLFEKKTVASAPLTFSSNDDSLGTVKATANGKEITSGTEVVEGSKVVITATPAAGKVVKGWEYDTILGPVTSYVSKPSYTILSYSTAQTIKVIFGEPSEDYVTIDLVDSNLTAYSNGVAVPDGGQILRGSNLYLSAELSEGERVTQWHVNAKNINTSANTLSLYNITKDTTVSVSTVADSYVSLTFASSDESMGRVTATCEDINEPYMERKNAPQVFAKLNTFSQSLMNMTTHGKNNVALAIGPSNGDYLFDGNHEWLFDTVMGVMPSDIQAILKQVETVIGTAPTYDALIFAWKNVLSYEMQQQINYFITYRAGFVSAPFVDETDGKEYQYVKFLVVTKDEPMSALSVDTIKQIYGMKDDFIDENSAENGGFVYAGYLSGAAVSNYETSELVNKDFKLIIVIVITMLILLLFLVLRSYLTPIRAVLTIVMSVVWTLGLTYLLFDRLLETPVVWVVPIVLFVVCLGLGMDYDILLTTRIKEYVSKGMSNDEAITAAVQKSGAIITLCGLIMAGAFGTMMVSTTPMLKEFGFALGFAIAVDALIIRTYVVPAIMHLMGDWNWKGPKFLKVKGQIGRRAGALFGLAASLTMLICIAIATGITDLSIDAIDMETLTGFNKDTEKLSKIAFGAGGAFAIMFGLFVAKFNRNIYARASGLVFAASAIMMMLATFATFQDFSPNRLWTVTFALSVVGALLYSGYLFVNRHPVGAGLMAIAVVGIAGAALAEAICMSYGLAIAAAGCILVASLCEMARLE